jgi:hypothetical protein
MFPDVIPNQIATILLRLFPDVSLDDVLISVRDTFEEAAETQSLGAVMPIDPNIERDIRELMDAEYELLTAEFDDRISTIRNRRSRFEKCARSYGATYERLQRHERWTSPDEANSVLCHAFNQLQADLKGGFVSTSPGEVVGVFRVHRQVAADMFLDVKDSEPIVISAGKDWYHLDPSVLNPKAMESTRLVFSVRDGGRSEKICPEVTVVEFGVVSEEFMMRRLREIEDEISYLSRKFAEDCDLLRCGSVTGDRYSLELTSVHDEIIDLLLGLKGLKRGVKATGTEAAIGSLRKRIEDLSRAGKGIFGLFRPFRLPSYVDSSLDQNLKRVLQALRGDLTDFHGRQ